MAGNDEPRLNPETKLQRHPDLFRSVALPNVVCTPGLPRSAVELSARALEILDGFARPCPIRNVVAHADVAVLSALTAWVRRGLLVRTARPLAPSRSLPPETRLWANRPALKERILRSRPARRETLGSRELAVVDDIFTPAEIAEAEACVLESPFHRSVRRGVSRDVCDWVVRVPFIDSIAAVVERAFPRRRLELYGAQANRFRYGDATFAHVDSKAPSLTALYHANARWEDEWGGEALFRSPGVEAAAVVAPRPGRVCIFDGRLTHRSGVPSRLCEVNGLTIAVKFWIKDQRR